MALPVWGIILIVKTVKELITNRHNKQKETIMVKKWYESKTLWLNFLGSIAIVLQIQYGFAVPIEWQTFALVGLNGILRLITKTEVVFK